MIKFILSKNFILSVVYVIVGFIIYSILKGIISKISKRKFVNNRKITIINLLRKIVKYVIYILVILAILNVYGIDTTSVLASLGIVGIVLGLAVQDILADFLAGLFILFDDQYTIGETVTINDFRGEVIGLGLMSTKIKSASGEVLILSNSSFKSVINHSRNNTNLYINLDVSYDTDIDKLEKILEQMRDDVSKINGYVDSYGLLGIQEFSSSSIKYMVTLSCKYNLQYQVRRDFNMLVKKYFDKYKIEIPYMKVDVNIRGKDE